MHLMDLVVGFLFQQCSGREVCANFSQLVKPLTDWMIFLVEHSQFLKGSSQSNVVRVKIVMLNILS